MTNPGIVGPSAPDKLAAVRRGGTYGSTPTYDPATSAFVLTGGPKYNAALHTYNLNDSAFPNWRLAFASQRAATATAKAVCAGDSITAGGTGVTTNIFFASYPGRLRTRLDTLTGTASGTGIVRADGVTDIPSSGPTTGPLAATLTKGGAGWSTTAGYGLAATLTFCSTATSTWTLSWTGAYSLRMHIARGVGASTNPHTTVLDSVASTSISNAGTGQNIITYATTGSGAHSLVITVAASAQLNIAGWELFPQATSGVQLVNAGVGSTTSDWPNTASAGSNTWYTHFTAYAPQLAIYMYGTNDMSTVNNVPISTFITNVQTFITNAKAISCDVLLVTPPRDNSSTNNSYTTFINALYALSDSNNVPLLDLRNRYAVNTGSYLDGIGHPNSTTTFDMSSAIYNVITAQL